jgi:hypothetical protein
MLDNMVLSVFECLSFTLAVTPVHRKLRTLLLWKWSWQPLSNSGWEMGILNGRNASDQREGIHSRLEVGTVARDVW